MQVRDIEIHTGKADFPVEATMAFSPAPTIDEANAKLRELATKVGANAVIEVEYNSGVSMTSWKSMKATGLAVLRESDEVACEVCAEPIRRAAIKCRFCGADRTAVAAAHSWMTSEPAPATASAGPGLVEPPPLDEPLKGTNNPQMWLIVGAIAFIILTIIGMAAG
jgi:hypothetical protein